MPSIIRKVTLAAFVIALLNFFGPVFITIGESIHEAVVVDTTETNADHFTVIACNFGPPPHAVARFWLVPLTLVAFIATRFRGLRNTFLSLVGLCGSTLIYLSWWRVVFRISDGAGIPISSIQHYGYLSGGTIVDLVLAAMIAWLIVMNVSVSLPSSH